mmetsp:Transcript_89805/g.159714  ORF Transcript_89805/g.159714 Transcript_89805/m.159714 type:complete len:352 (-) Transcript_89805:186-1241(-)|eukprot:CAMPEP_0197652214 /NCGR_PEP_ID=MMETSP1338-20131121/34306_1 /TAXON_ID=43686 ORGANISM="Pelagodinium beii, Strain RCC1491" /NCGR_SAMPLE_ID=MMETSP1338 /ASSEMBLY_ACC=CAM_ASM_000754 /LENGTH=351 /DNA_ID=CAMNT_0043227031 /DNA_START=132 /DNA_END=1187 /DNA_ORIENTATION=-
MGNFKDNAAVILGISSMAQVGCFCRLCLVSLMSADAHQMSSVLYANFLGCFAIGAITAMKDYLEEHHMGPTFYGINAGFCGALTTFSTWIFEVARWCIWWPNPAMQAVGGDWWGQRAVSAISAVLVELGVSCLGFQLGSSLLKDFSGFTSKAWNPRSQLPLNSGSARPDYSRQMTTCEYMHGEGVEEFEGEQDLKTKQRIGFASLLCLCLALPLLRIGTDSSLFFIMIFAPLGALVRYYLGLRYNSLSKAFRWGTFAANFLACSIFACITILNDVHGCFIGQAWTAGILKGIGFGFCGSLSTMSSLVAQLYEMELLKTPLYFFGSCLGCLSVYIVILGSYLALGGVVDVCA